MPVPMMPHKGMAKEIEKLENCHSELQSLIRKKNSDKGSIFKRASKLSAESERLRHVALDFDTRLRLSDLQTKAEILTILARYHAERRISDDELLVMLSDPNIKHTLRRMSQP
jgi:hypothetical protein